MASIKQYRKYIPYKLNNGLFQSLLKVYSSYLPNPSARAGYDTRSIF